MKYSAFLVAFVGLSLVAATLGGCSDDPPANGTGGGQTTAQSSGSASGGMGGMGSSSTGSTGGVGGAGGMSGTGGSGGSSGLCAPGSMTICYSGSPDTEGKGVCKAGTKTCMPDGMSYGPCMNEVLPSPDNCATSADEDCDMANAPCTGNGLWAKAFGGDFNQFGATVSADPAGNVLLAGTFSGNINLGDATFNVQGSPDLFLAKFDPSGAHLWSKGYIASGTAGYANAVVADENGDVYLTGFFYGGTDFGGIGLSPNGGGDIYLIKLDAAGNLQWAKSFGDSQTQSPWAMAARPGGGVVVVGTFAGTVNFGGNLLTGTSGSQDMFVASFDGAGNHIWSNRFGDGDIQNGKGVGVDAQGNVYVAAQVQGSIKFGPTVLASAGYSDLAIAKFGPTGMHEWSKIIGNTSVQTADWLAVAPNGNVFVTGTSGGAVDFGNGTPQSPPTPGGFYLLSLDSAGAFRWVRQWGNGYGPTGLRVASDSFGNALLTAGFVGTLDFGGGALTTASTTKHDVFVLKLSPSGDHVWSKRYGDSTQQDDYQHSLGIATDPAGNVLVGGYMAGVTDFGTGDIYANDPSSTGDAFVAKLAP